MKKMIFWGLLIPLFFCISCNDETTTQEAVISLNQTELVSKDTGGDFKIELTAVGNWTTDNVPDWITLSHTSGDSSQDIIVAVQPNKDSEGRVVEIIFINGSLKATLKISQAAMKKELAWSRLSFSSFENVSFEFGKNNIERTYHFATLQLFVNPDVNPAMNEKLFLGNLINPNLSSNTDLSEYKGYTFNPITVYSSIGTEHSQTFIPSKSAQNAFSQKITSLKPAQSESFRSDAGVVYGSHRELNLIGRGNLGINLDEVISGHSYREQEMVKHNGVIFSFCHTLFTLCMDLQEHVVKEELKPSNFPSNSLSYITSVSYGRIGVLIIESDYSVTKIKALVNKVMQNTSVELSQEETTILNELTAYHLYFDDSLKQQVVSGKLEVIKAYIDKMTTDQYSVYPFKFTVSDYFAQGETEMNFGFKLY